MCGIKVQGLFLKRQTEVSAQFAELVSNEILTSQAMWEVRLSHTRGPIRYLAPPCFLCLVSACTAPPAINVDDLLLVPFYKPLICCLILQRGLV